MEEYILCCILPFSTQETFFLSHLGKLSFNSCPAKPKAVHRMESRFNACSPRKTYSEKSICQHKSVLFIKPVLLEFQQTKIPGDIQKKFTLSCKEFCCSRSWIFTTQRCYFLKKELPTGFHSGNTQDRYRN